MDIVLYDDHCPLCTFQMKALTWLDWFNAVSLVPLSNPRASQIAPGLSRSQLLEAIHCVRPDGRVLRGARALRHVGLRMPGLAPLALLLWFPGVIWIAERIYAWVSRNRHLIGRLFGCGAACQVMPVRPGHAEHSFADPAPSDEALQPAAEQER